ncbi:YihY/virulence factor BrkB family protein [Gordonia sp. (in: high G+C Gram-positive bacteria)]|uniref:YihY/virulence factor BrkB family protein n=2 Tax=Gordonia TaxID=2053 RepID=UPI003C73D1A2
MSLVSALDGFQRRHPVVGYPLGVAYKYFDDQGGYLAALIAYYGFVSLFPLLVVFTTVLGIVLEHHQELKEQVIASTLDQIPVVGSQLADPAGLSGSTTTVIIGLIGAVYGGLGVAVAVQNAMNVAWTVPRNSRPNPIKVRLRGAVLLFTVGLTMIAMVAINIIVASVDLGAAGSYVTEAGVILLGVGVFTFAFRFSTARPLSVRDVLPGAVLAAVGWQGLQHFGRVYVERVIIHSRDVTGVFAVVLGLVAFLYLAAVMLVLCVEINVVRVDRMYPRALLTEFTDNVRLTDGDEIAYARAAQAQRNKGFEVVTVEFDNPLEREVDAPDAPPAAKPIDPRDTPPL